MNKKMGMSLLELIAVLVVLGIIMGIATTVTIGVIHRQQRNACEASCENVSKTYAAEMMFNINPTYTYEEILDQVLIHDYGFECERENMYKGICPSDCLCKVTVNQIGNIEIYCETHGEIQSTIGTDQIFSSIFNTEEFNNYFNSPSHDRTVLDSTGVNFGQPITESIASSLGIDMSDYSWKIERTGKDTSDKSNFTTFITPINISSLNAGDKVSCTKYTFNSDGTVASQSIVELGIITKTMKDSDGKTVTYNVIV